MILSLGAVHPPGNLPGRSCLVENFKFHRHDDRHLSTGDKKKTGAIPMTIIVYIFARCMLNFYFLGKLTFPKAHEQMY